MRFRTIVGSTPMLVALAGLFRDAAGQEPLELTRLSAPVELDGRSDEPAWSAIEPLPLVRHQPVFGGSPAERTEIRIAYDDHYIYAAGRFYARDPRSIQTNSLTRDRLSGDDVFRLLLDTFNDSENAFGFATNPAGVRQDFSVSNDGRDGTNESWNTFWDVATSRDAAGWYAEMRIPLSSLRFQEVGGRIVMGLIASRFTARHNETATYPALSPRWASATTRPSVAAKVSLRGVRNRRPLYLTPYALEGFSRDTRLNASGEGFSRPSETTTEAGLDLKYGVSSNLTLDATVNTDFAQVEVDDQQVNLTRFSLFFPEKRQFFLERAGIFEVNTGGFGDASRLFFSRTIGLTPDGLPLRIYGGARAVGRIGGWDIGVLDMQTAGRNDIPSENHGVLRLRRQVGGGGSYVGGILTSRLGTDGSRNVAYGADGQIRVLPNDYVAVQWAQTFDDDRPGAGLDAGMVRALWERRSVQGLVYRAGAKWSGPEHDPGLGFQPRRDVKQFEANVRYGFFFGERTIFQNVQPSLLFYTFLRNATNTIDTRAATLYLNFDLKSGVYGDFNVANAVEDLPSDVSLGNGAVIPAGRYDFTRFGLNVSPPEGGSLRAGFGIGFGPFYDGDQLVISVAPTWNVSRHLELGAEYEINRIRFDGRDQRLDADLARIRVQTSITPRLSANTYLQYNRAADAVVGNVRVRYHFSEGRDLYLVYNERLNTDRAATEPVLPLSQARTLLLKYTHTFVPN